MESEKQDDSYSNGTVTNYKRQDYLEWADYFMSIAMLSAKRSKDPVTQVGACLVNEEKRIVGIGYNGMPNGCSDDDFPWGKLSKDRLETKKLYVCHAEMNAILNKYAANLTNCSIYVTLFPCNECAKLIIQSGIKNVIYLSDKHQAKVEYVASRRMLGVAGITCSQFKPAKPSIEIDFDSEP